MTLWISSEFFIPTWTIIDYQYINITLLRMDVILARPIRFGLLGHPILCLAFSLGFAFSREPSNIETILYTMTRERVKDSTKAVAPPDKGRQSPLYPTTLQSPTRYSHRLGVTSLFSLFFSVNAVRSRSCFARTSFVVENFRFGSSDPLRF